MPKRSASATPRGFVLHGNRLRLSNVSFAEEDAAFIASEAERDDIPAALVLRRIVREARERRGA